MPMLRIRGIEEIQVKKGSQALVDDLSRIVGCPRDYFTLELVTSVYIMDGERTPQQPIIEVLWFDRGQEVQDQAAKAITDHLRGDLESLEVFFIPLQEKNYYENGEHF